MRQLKVFFANESATHTPMGVSGYTSASSITSDPIYLGNAYGMAIQASWPGTGTPVGTFKLQACGDIERDYTNYDTSNLVNWADIASSSTASSSGSPIIWNINGVMYRWARIVYTVTSGSITLTVTATVKAISG